MLHCLQGTECFEKEMFWKPRKKFQCDAAWMLYSHCLHFIAFWIMKCIGANFFCAWQFSIKFREMYFIFLYCLESQWEFQNYWFSPLWFKLYGSHIFFLPLFLISLSIIFFFSQVSWNSNTHDNSWQPEAQMKHTCDTTIIVPNPLKFTHKAHPQSRIARTNGPKSKPPIRRNHTQWPTPCQTIHDNGGSICTKEKNNSLKRHCY